MLPRGGKEANIEPHVDVFFSRVSYAHIISLYHSFFIHANSLFEHLLLYSICNKTSAKIQYTASALGPFANKTTNELSTTTSPRLVAWGKVSINARVKSISSFKSTALQNARLRERKCIKRLSFSRKDATKLLLKMRN